MQAKRDFPSKCVFLSLPCKIKRNIRDSHEMVYSTKGTLCFNEVSNGLIILMTLLHEYVVPLYLFRGLVY